MARFDAESFMDFIVTTMKENLNDKLDEITTEKADTIELPHIEEEAYFDDLNEKVINFKQFIYYGFPDITNPNGNSAGVSEEITMSFEVVFPGVWGGAGDKRKIMRYTRAMKEVIQENLRSNAYISDFEIQTFQPVQVKANEISLVAKVGSISITGVIAN